ncbi:fimbrial protein [Pseudomonas pergaminensis]|uniref:fimbrial protein n=1 Tax=Pseudomonas TaxID=286 RepID=UPI001BDE6A76|nr:MULTISPECIES: fimbrial protein [unclassified Pseudomonas]MBT1264049.1 type 1 fimbrial protein [Pseudomonas sp. VS40]MBT1275829.1 type 1 fimbrial protein [Pseudomonas sp. VS59]
MRKYIKTLASVSAAIACAHSVAATNVSGGVISFSGMITDTTCTINGGKSADFTVALAPITVAEAGAIVGPILKNKKSFSMTFSGCNAASSNVTNPTAPTTPLLMYFSSADNISTDGKYLVNTSVNESDAAVAKNVGFSLGVSGTQTPVQLNTPFNTGIIGAKKSPESDTLVFDAYYYKTNTAAAKIGTVSSSLIYTISYL